MVALFLLSVIAIVLAVNLVVSAVYLLGFAEGPQFEQAGSLSQGMRLVPMHVYAMGAAITLGIIAVVSIANIIGLADGGARVARMLGARAVSSGSQDPLERRFLNIVEEMAIASGVRLPQAYVMDNERATAINPGEAIEEKVSLSDRFGLWLGFHRCSQDEYLAMVEGYVTFYRVPFERNALVAEALEWATTRGARSGRVAWQYVQDLAGRLGVPLSENPAAPR